MKTTKQLESLDWQQLPVDAGQIIDVHYAVDGDHDGATLYRRTHDRSDGTISYESAEIEMAGDAEFAPWNGLLPNHGEWESI